MRSLTLRWFVASLLGVVGLGILMGVFIERNTERCLLDEPIVFDRAAYAADLTQVRARLARLLRKPRSLSEWEAVLQEFACDAHHDIQERALASDMWAIVQAIRNAITRSAMIVRWKNRFTGSEGLISVFMHGSGCRLVVSSALIGSVWRTRLNVFCRDLEGHWHLREGGHLSALCFSLCFFTGGAQPTKTFSPGPHCGFGAGAIR